MMKLNIPEYSIKEAIELASEGITRNLQLKLKIEHEKEALIKRERNYIELTRNGDLYTIAPIDSTRNHDPIVGSELKKSDLIKLYGQYFVPENKPARKIYEEILNSAKEQCPFCGGIGTPRNLDHFLPKAYFPQFSILPCNLVPACRDCNMDGKAEAFAADAEDQIIQPYLDKDIFFDKQWIFAEYIETDNNSPGIFNYTVKSPPEWEEVDKKRADKHFNDFGLARRYATKAAEHLGIVLNQIKTMQEKDMNNDTIIECLIRPAVKASPFLNHWKTGMYQAIETYLT